MKCIVCLLMFFVSKCSTYSRLSRKAKSKGPFIIYGQGGAEILRGATYFWQDQKFFSKKNFLGGPLIIFGGLENKNLRPPAHKKWTVPKWIKMYLKSIYLYFSVEFDQLGICIILVQQHGKVGRTNLDFLAQGCSCNIRIHQGNFTM